MVFEQDEVNCGGGNGGGGGGQQGKRASEQHSVMLHAYEHSLYSNFGILIWG